jgi:hypothetical protein
MALLISKHYGVDDRMFDECGAIGKGNLSALRKSAPLPLCPPNDLICVICLPKNAKGAKKLLISQ